jgi:hypothetical protein
MQTAMSWLLTKLDEEGRHDLVEQYHENNKAYQREKSIAERERKLSLCKETLAQYNANDAYSLHLRRMIEKHEKSLEKLRQA